MPKVSVVMAVYNGEAYLSEAIVSILTQTLADFEFLVVDDGSQDASAQIIQGWQQRDERIRLLRMRRNMGMADARNRGIEAAAGAYITFMDCDDISLPKRLEKQVAFLEAHPEIGGVGTEGELVDKDLSQTLYRFRLPQQHALILFDMLGGVSFIYTTVMFRRELLQAVGGYEAGRRSGEERELPWRMLKQTSIQFANLPESLYRYRRHEHSHSATRSQVPQHQAQADEIKARILRELWGEAPLASLDRLQRMAKGQRLDWAERRRARRDMERLIDALLVKSLVAPHDKALLTAEMRRRLERMMPRWARKLSQWRRTGFHRRVQPAASGDEPDAG
ncbi:MAG: glycosyltransferase family A protein [Chloroflexi bacterium]|nr:glycosyltransferase family A protein [Chloroflexota bacterium]MCY4247425.1 glycosyltransferase family A protein [Chloroflexota bacterium]